MKINPYLKEELKKFLKEKMKQEAQKIVLISAHKLSGSEKQDILNKFPEFKGKKLEMEVDPDLMAGFVIRRGSKMADFSLSGKINQLRQKTHETS